MRYTKKLIPSLLGCYGLLAIAPAASQMPETLIEPSQSGPLNSLPSPSRIPTSSTADSESQLRLSKQLQPRQPQDQPVTATRIEVLGVNSVEFAEIASFFQPLSGTQTTIGHLSNATALATQHYQKAGFPLSFVYLPEQSFEHGIVRVIAIEGHLSQVDIQGDPGKSEALVRAIVQPLLSNKPLTTAAFQRQSLLLSRMDNLKITPAATLPTTTDGATPLQLKIERSPIAFNINTELKQSESKAIANLTLNDPFWGGSQWLFTALLDKPSDERFASTTWRQWLNAKGTQLRWSYSDFKGKDNFYSGYLEDTTSQRRVELALLHPLELSMSESSTVGLTLFGLNYHKNYDLPTYGLQLLDHEKVRGLQALWSWQKSASYYSQSANIALTEGLDIWGAGAERSNNLGLSMETNRAKFNFTRLNFDYAIRWRFQNMFGAAVGASGQLSPNALPISERVSFGGTRFGRGYRRGEAAGDQGVGISLEINHLFAVQAAKWLKTWEPFFIYEHAKTLFKNDDLPSQKLQSSTMGIRLSDGKYYALELYASKPHGDQSPYNPQKKLRYGLQLTYQLDI